MTNSHGFGGMYVNQINELEKCILHEIQDWNDFIRAVQH